MRLIDADMLKKYMINNSKEVERFLGYIDEALPTCSTWNHNSDNISRNAAIEIVKRGQIG